MKRRAFMVGVGVGAAALLAFGAPPAAAQSGKARRIGFLEAGSRSANHTFLEAFRDGMTALGWNIGRDLKILDRWAEADGERLPALVAELLAAEVDLLVTAATPATLAARRATATVPIVSAGSSDLVKIGAVNSLARPGGNVTGLYLQQAEITAKRVELLKEAIPALTDIAALADAFTTATSEQMRVAETAARRLQVRLVSIVVPGAPPYDFAAAITAARERGAGALLALMSPAFFYDRARFVQEVLRQRMSASFGLREFADLGGLMSYGADLKQTFARLADYADKILNGANPAELPIEQPTKFELILNLKTAKALGLTLPPLILARADEVIE
jgi:putative ABC transport system substrate-binding protein